MDDIDVFIEGLGNISFNEKVIKVYEFAQSASYRVCQFVGCYDILKNGFGDCRHKHAFLLEVYKRLGLECESVKVLFDWQDLPIPKRIINTLSKSGTIFYHSAILVKREGKGLLVDATWPLSYEIMGFPVTKNWNGKCDTKMVTDGDVRVYSLDEYEELENKPLLVKEELSVFADKLNEFLEENG